MTRQEITGDVLGFKNWPINTEKSGVYRGSRGIPGKYGKEQMIWEFTDEDGLPFGIYGVGALDKRMKSISPGTFVYITYQGTKSIQGKNVHQVKVEKDVTDEDGENVAEEVPKEGLQF